MSQILTVNLGVIPVCICGVVRRRPDPTTGPPLLPEVFRAPPLNEASAWGDVDSQLFGAPVH